MPEPGAGRLLVVDDKQENLLALASVLADEGYDMVEALSGSEAITLAEKNDLIAILMDVQMPILDGYQAAKLIRQIPRHKNTPIVFVTAIHRSEELEERGYLAGAIDYLFKPINTTILKAKLSVFSQLYKQKEEIQAQAALINERTVREKENELLKESLKARDQFLSMASHELKTPITPLSLQMQSFLQMLENDTFKSADQETLKRMLMTSHSQVKRLSKTIDNLLDVSRFSTGHMQLSFEKVNLSRLVSAALDTFSAQLKDVGCDWILDAETDVTGEWDPFRVEQVFLNLLSNAMKYGAGKPIVVRVALLDGVAELHVTDHGIGIAPADQARIFNRFERAVSPAFFGGLGLGLYISCEIVRLHQGQIIVNSQLGKGATFTVKLPIAK